MMTMTSSESSWETAGTASNIENSNSNTNAASSWSSTGATSDRLLTGSGESGCTGPMCPSASDQGIFFDTPYAVKYLIDDWVEFL